MVSMSVLSGGDLIHYLRKEPPIVDKMKDPRVQVGVNGIDLSVGKVERFDGPGIVGFKSEDTTLPSLREVRIESSTHLDPGAYKITYNEEIHVPMNFVAVARPRSTLLRLGVTVETALWDSGYEGISESLLLVHNPSGVDLHKNARVVQLVFLKGSQRVMIGYRGRYYREHLMR